MKKILTFLSIIGLVGCKPQDEVDKRTDVATHASGRYAIQYYIIDKDTMWSTRGINKLGIDNFYVEVKRLGPDSVSVMKYYVKNGQNCGLGSSARIQKRADTYELVGAVNAPDIYHSNIKGDIFYERTVGMNVDSLQRRWEFDSLKSPYVPLRREIVISAVR